MKSQWTLAAPGRGARPTDFGSDIVNAMSAAILVFDAQGRMSFANTAAYDRDAVAVLVDERGRLASPEFEEHRELQARGREEALPTRLRCQLQEGETTGEFVSLSSCKGWTALLIFPEQSPLGDAVDLDPQLLSHELSRPLLSARASVEELTQLSEAAPQRFRDQVARQARAVQQLADLVQGLALLSAGTGRGRLPMEPLNLTEIVQELSSSYGDLAAAKGFTFQLGPVEAVPPVLGNAELLRRAIGNLLDNALKYSQEPGPIRLGVRLSGAVSVIEVADRGPGIAVTEQRRIFAPFVRLPRAAGSPVSGSGLGLAVARRIAEAHGGVLAVQSTAGGPSIFRLTLLARAEQGRVAPVGQGKGIETTR